MSIEVIDIENENYVRKPTALKISRIIDEIFKELAESSGNAQSHDEVMNSIIEIMEKKIAWSIKFIERRWKRHCISWKYFMSQ